MVIAIVVFGLWAYLFCAHGWYWRSAPQLEPALPGQTPDIDIIVPARDEAETIARVIASLAAQAYAGSCRVILVDDGSQDGTAELAIAAMPSGGTIGLEVLRAAPKPNGWSGKMWAVSQGVAAARAPVLLLTDADIEHDPRHLATLVARLYSPPVDMVSEMVRLNCSSPAERWLVPAFVYFFQMLYPFSRVNRPASSVAAAAGGTILIRRTALERIGGIESIKHALIDDVALAQRVKRGGPIFLGHSRLAVSIRRYPALADIWGMIERTAFTQLNYSAPLLAGTLLGLALVWWVPLGIAVLGHGWERALGCIACGLAASSFLPTLRRYRRNWLWSLILPLTALFYMAATVSSARAHWRGGGARWKSRHYGSGEA